MSFAARESSRSKGRPVSLYLFRYGDTPNAYFAYTDAERPVETVFEPEVGPVVFKPIAIQRTRIVKSGSLDKAPLTVKTPQDAELADLFTLYPPSQVVNLTIFDGHAGDLEFKIVWSGRVLSHASEVNEAVYTCEPVSTSQKRVGLTRNYQIGCPLTLYSQGEKKCNASMAAATSTTVAVTVDGPLVTLPSSWAAADRKQAYVHGFARWTTLDGRTERRTIIRVNDGDELVLSGQAIGLTAGMAIDVVLGCRHDMADCKDLHNNILNYGGQFAIPTDNPFGIKNNFY